MLKLLKVLNETEINTVAQLAHRIWNNYYPEIIGQEQVNYMLQKFYDIEALEQQIKSGQSFYLIENQHNTIGFVSVSKKEEGLMFIHKFYVDSNQQNQGIGFKVFEMIKSMHPQLGFELTVNRQNMKAINFYFKIGFKIKEVADFDIGNGFVMNDFVMKYQ